MMRVLAIALAALLALGVRADAHVGSPDVFFEGAAGPYRLLVAVRPPEVVPGVAAVEIRAADADLRELRIVPLPISGPGARFAPTPDLAVRSREDPRLFTGNLWMMSSGSWQVRVLADGARGRGEVAVPVPALALRTLDMQRGLGAVLLALALVLALGVVSIAGAAVREAVLEPGAAAGSSERRRARWIMGGAAALVAGALWLGDAWWADEAARYARHVWRPVELAAEAAPGGRLVIRFRGRRLDDLVPDHGHLVHLFVVALPGLDRLCHLHPVRRADGAFEAALPQMPAGRCRIFADIVHKDGLGETGTATLDLAETPGAPLAGDDSARPTELLRKQERVGSAPSPEGAGRIVWEKPAAPLRKKEPVALRFRLEDEAGRPARDVELYMGMLGHLVIVGKGGAIFAHVHPAGSVPMAALALLGEETHGRIDAELCGTGADAGTLPARVSFPFGFPEAGEYRLFVQMKHGGRIETAAIDVRVGD